MKPEWVIYKNEQRIGQAVTWHKALDILVKQEKLSLFTVSKFQQVYFVNDLTYTQTATLKIVKER